MPYTPACQRSSRTISSSRSSRPSSISSAVRRAIRATCSCVSAGLAEPSIPITRRSRSWPANPAIIPACVLPVTEHTITVSKNTSSSRSCTASSCAQRAKPSPPSSWSDAPAGIA
jgi:hypothetical protein